MNGHRQLPPALSMPLLAGLFVVLAVLERRRPLRREVDAKGVRMGRNLMVAALGGLAIRVAETPVVRALTRVVLRRRWGLLQRLPVPRRLELPLALVLLDYSLYLWHVLTHRVPALWRFHIVHHLDRDLDVSTALRFHAGELLLSVPWRAAQVVVIGVSPRALSVWQTALLASIMFHHSNVRLPERWERRLSRVLVTPRLHGIHHSVVPEETNTNWSSGLTVWDRLHGTLRCDVPQAAITIGVPAYRAPEDGTLPRLLALPFLPSRPGSG